MSLRLRLSATFSVLLGVLLLTVGTSLQLFTQSSAEQDTLKLLKGAEKRLLTEARRRGGLDLNDFLAEERAFADEPFSVAELDLTGKVIGHVGAEMPENGSVHWKTRNCFFRGRHFLLGIPWYQTQAVLKRQAISLVYTGLTTWLLVSLAGWALVGLTLRPLSMLSRQALERSRLARAEPLVSPSSDAELGYLVNTLNQLLETIRGTVAAQGRFYSAASHELRTPLQALLGHLELCLSRARSVEEYQSTLEQLQAQTQRLCDLVQALLVMNQIETAQARTLFEEELDLKDVLDHRLTQLPPTARERVTFKESQPCPVVCTPSYAQILMGNLLDNALKYSPPGTPVEVSLLTDHLEIRNTTTTVLREPERLFEAFYRPDASRSSSTGGNGLGLALCKAVADQKGWVVSLTAQGEQVVARVDLRTPVA